MKISVRKIKKISIFFLMLQMFGILLSGCGAEEEKITEITLIHGWGSMDADHVTMRQIYSDFEKKHPEIRLNLIAMPSSMDVIDKSGDLLLVGEVPDIIFTGGEGRESIYEFMVEKGYAVDMMPYIQRDKELREDISPLILDYWTTEDGALYTVSDVLLLGGYWYNRKMFQEAGINEIPQTWEDMLEVCRRLEEHRAGKKVMVLDEIHIIYLLDAMLAEKNPEILEEVRYNNRYVESEEFRAAMHQMKALAEYSEIMSNDYRDTLADFNQEKTAIYINGVWASSMIRPEIDAVYAAFPGENGDIATISSCIGYILGNTKDEDRINASMEFIKYMLSDEVAKRILTETEQVPSNPSVKVTQEDRERLHQAVSAVQNAENIIETPENVWNNDKKEKSVEAMASYLKGNIAYKELQNRLYGY